MIAVLWAVSLSWADAPDSDLLLDNARRGVNQPPGCWMMAGVAQDKWNAGIFGKGERTWALTGVLQDGVWTEWTQAVTTGKPADKDQDRRSLFGRSDKPDDPSAERVNVLDMLQDDVAVEYVEPDGAGWKLVRSLKGGDQALNTLELRYDAALRPTAWAIHIVDAVRIKTPKGTKARIVSMDARLTATAAGAPLTESMVGTFAKWPFSVDVDVRTVWTGVGCAGTQSYPPTPPPPFAASGTPPAID